MRKELRIGLLLSAVFLILKQFPGAPEFLLGLLAGGGICFEIVGILPDKTYNSLKAFKRKKT